MQKNITGHDKQKRILSAAVKNNKLAHAYLFTGRDGVGKKTLALEFARLVNCENPDYQNFRACAVCVSCVKQTQGLNPDILLVQAEKNSIKREQIAELLNSNSLSSIFNKYKFKEHKKETKTQNDSRQTCKTNSRKRKRTRRKYRS